MAKFRKKPDEIEAMLWTGENIFEISEFLNQNILIENGLAVINTPDGTLRAQPGLYIVRNNSGCIYTSDPVDIELRYEPVD